ncbi:PTS lactose/cellobiose transporter subunit IIA [Lentilactobacillus sp. IMAU92037]|uniref:PTS lactose/cellobiose transporter subunit IIA n=1 Tax=Lentilactobacillus dabitei TaxID=2831523 RepID=UPI001C2C2BBB|nr:PTS lactose/cellobiose transporter subunit IIA [Lentilactobacillus dabitei]MBV0930126.1 PTS lactose/cellobiose transporter subunit IIA [Lentilactobacillus dabitei]
MDENELDQISMLMLTYSGKAKQILNQTIDTISLSTYKKDDVPAQFEKAHKWLIKAHNEQNKAIKYVDNLQYSVLFTHAQDTLMNTETIYFLLTKLIPLIRISQ